MSFGLTEYAPILNARVALLVLGIALKAKNLSSWKKFEIKGKYYIRNKFNVMKIKFEKVKYKLIEL